jgi:predicted O-methyltransferase YrrM
MSFKITKNSLDLVKKISEQMKGKTFHNHYHILYDIADSIDKESITYLEIGAYAGGSASLMSMHNKVRKSYSIDIGKPIDKNIVIENVSKFKNSICEYQYFKGDSTKLETIKEVKSVISEVDIFFIDGDHRYQAVISDFKNYSDLVCSGGYIIFDDYLDKVSSPDVRFAVDYLCETLDKEKYEIIGSLNYELLKDTDNPNLGGSNEFVLKKL